ncbi:MAG: SGNH/GDSL hydrolase family protein [Clostridia bacterium]|nr:SGNH/GDSL hydrolase family protein [Clostridia bacterium]
MKKVMLIGDSIRMNYQSVVEKELSGEYSVWGPYENCRFAKYTLVELQRYIVAFSQNEKEKNENIDQAKITPTIDKTDDVIYPDIIHWNNGLWDTGVTYEEDGPLTPIDEYIRDMSIILRELRKMTDKIIFATITPVKSGTHQDNDIIKEYNNRIIEFMKSENVFINDLGALVSENMDEYISEDKIHLSEKGKEICGKAVAKCIREIDN